MIEWGKDGISLEGFLLPARLHSGFSQPCVLHQHVYQGPSGPKHLEIALPVRMKLFDVPVALVEVARSTLLAFTTNEC